MPPYYDLLEADTFRELSARPEYLRQTLSPQQPLVIVDEIQKLPALLDEIQILIERNKKLRVILTGSSARKLKRGAANLLGGRAWVCRLHPLVSAELDGQRLLDRLNRGSLPSIIDSEHYKEDLKAYVGTYLHEEIRAEGLTRSIENFSRFLEVAGLTSGEQINFSSVAADAGFPPRTVREHYQILEDICDILPRSTVVRSRRESALLIAIERHDVLPLIFTFSRTGEGTICWTRVKAKVKSREFYEDKNLRSCR